MKLYLISDQQLDALVHGSAHECEGALQTVVEEQECTVERVISARRSVEADRNKGGAQ